MRPAWKGFLSAVAGLVVVTACGSSNDTLTVIRVPDQVATIARAAAEAKRGTIIEIAPGVYHEAVSVEVPGITLRGADRNEVVLDGRFTLANGISVKANDVAVENLTVRNYNQNGIVFNGIAAAAGGPVDPSVDYGTGDDVLTGYRVSWVTTHNNGLYGVYAFASRDGLIEHSYASGHPDSGFYVGQCQPCNVVIRNVTAERNAIGYYGTNASGGVWVVQSVFRNNRMGIAPNSQDMERLAPQAEAVVAGNLVADNNEASAPRIPEGYVGGGIAVGGGTRNTIVRNRVTGHQRAGIELLDLNGYLPEGNRIEGNVLTGNAVDLLYAVKGAARAAGNCFVGNRFTRSLPDNIEMIMGCDLPEQPFTMPVAPVVIEPPQVDFRTVSPPGAQQSMPADQWRTVGGAGPVPVVVLAEIEVPT
jgi:hypothetical protein